MAQTLAELQAELAKITAERDALAARTTRTEPRKENSTFVPMGVLGEKQIEIPVSYKSMKFLPSKKGKSLVSTVQVNFPDGVRGQLLLTKKLA